MNIYIGNLHPQVTEEKLRLLFKPFGKINSVNIITDMETGQSKGFGFVEIDDNTDANNAINGLNTIMYMDMELEVSKANPRPVTENKFVTDSVRKKLSQQPPKRN